MHATHNPSPITRNPVAEKHTFSSKERDTETGLSYFGARYYSSELSIWMSVDPMADKYPSLSPYVYCANNPVKLVDPNGEEVYEFDESGKFLRVYGKTGSPDQISIKKKDGTSILSKEYSNGTIKLGDKFSAIQKDGNSVEVQSLSITGDAYAEECFKFASDNSNVEWGLCQAGTKSGSNGVNFLSNSQEYDHEGSSSHFFNSLSNIRSHWHSHPNDLKPSNRDYITAEKLREKFGDSFSPDGYVPTYIYSKGKSLLYNGFIRMLDQEIEKCTQQYLQGK